MGSTHIQDEDSKQQCVTKHISWWNLFKEEATHIVAHESHAKSIPENLQHLPTAWRRGELAAKNLYRIALA